MNINLKLILCAVLISLSSFSLAVVDSDGDGIGDDIDTVMETDGKIVILSDTLWAAGDISLNSDVQIAYGVTLTIPAGTILEGNNNEVMVFGELLIKGVSQNTKIKQLRMSFGDFSSKVGYIQINDSIIELGSFFSGSGYGSFDITDSLLKEVRGFYIWYPQQDSSVVRNIFQDSSGMRILLQGTPLLIKNNVFITPTTNYAVEVLADYQSTLKMEFNSFMSTDRIAVGLAKGYSSANMTAINNYFGTTDESVIRNMILDANDDLEYASEIEYIPFLTEPHPDTPVQIDTDGDRIFDYLDAFPANALYSMDSDSDGIPNKWEVRYGLDPNDASDATSDQDNDGVAALDEFLAGTIPAGSLDIDGNGQYDALTDGLLLLRGMFLLSGDSLISDAVASDAVYKTSGEVASRIDMLGDLVDIDGNGTVDALTDGLVILRYLFNLRGDVLINDVIASDATVKTAEDVEAKIEQLIPAL